MPGQWKSTGQTMLAVCFFGVSGVIASFVGGLIIEAFNGAALYSFMAVIASAGCLTALAVDMGNKKKAQRDAH